MTGAYPPDTITRRDIAVRSRYFWLCGLLAMFLAVLAFLPHVIVSGGALTLIDDFDTQQIPFTAHVGEMIRNYTGQWDWSLDLGSSMITGYSFYNLGSPFFWLSVLFPKTAVPYLMAPLFVLKYMIAAMTAFAYLRMLLKDERWAVFGAVLYAFSGFQSYNLMFFHFHDVVALFPLLLIGLEKLMDDGRNGPFALAVAINCLCNYFFFISEVVFLIIYYICRRWDRIRDMIAGKLAVRQQLSEIAQCVMCGIAGILAAGILFVPSVLYVAGSNRVDSVAVLDFSLEGFLSILRGFLMPLDVMHSHFALKPGDWYSRSCYLPLWGVVLVIGYIVKKRDWLSNLILVLTGMSFIFILNAVFYLMSTTVYMRWWYMLVLVMSLASARMMEERDSGTVNIGVKIAVCLVLAWSVLVILFGAVLGIMPGVNRWGLFVVNIIMVAGAAVFCGHVYSSDRITVRGHIGLVSAAALALTCGTLGLYRLGTGDGSQVLDVYDCAMQLPEQAPMYRYDAESNLTALVGNAPGVTSFASTVSNSITEFNASLGFFRDIIGAKSSDRAGLRELVGARYYYSRDTDGSHITETHAGSWDLYIMEQPACPIGFAAKRYMTASELEAIPREDRAVAMLYSTVVPDDLTGLVPETVVHDVSYTNDEDSIAGYTEVNSARAVADFQRDNGGFSCRTNYAADALVYFSVPSDDGWTCYIDGDETGIIDSAGMMAVAIPGGAHELVFTYETPGFRTGGYCTAFGFVCVFALFLTDIERKRSSISYA